ncbi:MAG: site-specific integrase [Bacteroidales bacterium]|nr:site-specific integrase [Bacteroidales bacterium]
MAIYKRGGVWWVDVYSGVPPKRIRRSTKTDDETKARIIEQTMIGVNRGTTQRQQAVSILDALLPQQRAGVQLSDLVQYYQQCLTDEREDMTRRTIKQRVNNLRAFVEWAGRNCRCRTVEEIGAEEAFGYSQELGKRGMLGKTQNAYLGDMSTVWKMLQKRSKVTANPWSLVRVKRDKENEHTGRAFTDQEIERILAVCKRVGHDWYGMVVIGLYTGLRMPDVANLRWTGDPRQDLIADLKGRRIYGTPSKTALYKTVVDIPMHDRIAALLKSLPRAGEFVLPWRQAHPASYKARGTDVTFAEILAEAGVGKKDARDKISFHCLRHTFVTRLSQAGVPQDVRMRLAGHTQTDTSEIYTHDRESSRSAIEKLK